MAAFARSAGRRTVTCGSERTSRAPTSPPTGYVPTSIDVAASAACPQLRTPSSWGGRAVPGGDQQLWSGPITACTGPVGSSVTVYGSGPRTTTTSPAAAG